MAAPLAQPTPVTESPSQEWLRKRVRGSAHLVIDVRGFHWSSPCGAVATSDRKSLFPSNGAIQCARCVRAVGDQPSSVVSDKPLTEASEAQVLSWLRGYYGGRGAGNGDRFSFATHVRAGAGFDVRTADGIAMDLWKSKGLELHGHEVKVSRSDWKAELRDPEKWRAVGRYMDRWWIAVPDLAIVRADELRPEWGLLHCSADGVKIARRAPKLSPDPVDRPFLAALFRAATKASA